jgi:hypothetical protein
MRTGIQSAFPLVRVWAGMRPSPEKANGSPAGTLLGAGIRTALIRILVSQKHGRCSCRERKGGNDFPSFSEIQFSSSGALSIMATNTNIKMAAQTDETSFV